MEVEIATAKNDCQSDSFTQEVVREAFGEDLYTEHVKITIKNPESTQISEFLCQLDQQQPKSEFKTFKQTYFGTSPRSMGDCSNSRNGQKRDLSERDDRNCDGESRISQVGELHSVKFEEKGESIDDEATSIDQKLKELKEKADRSDHEEGMQIHVLPELGWKTSKENCLPIPLPSANNERPSQAAVEGARGELGQESSSEELQQELLKVGQIQKSEQEPKGEPNKHEAFVKSNHRILLAKAVFEKGAKNNGYSSEPETAARRRKLSEKILQLESQLSEASRHRDDGKTKSELATPPIVDRVEAFLKAKGQKLQQQNHANNSSPTTHKYHLQSALKDGYESDSNLIIKRVENFTPNPRTPIELKSMYSHIQKGGDIPAYGLRMNFPERPSEPRWQYNESEVNIHYRTPVRKEEKQFIPDHELRRQQEERMRKIYEDIEQKKELSLLQDMESRKHHDSWLPYQKSPVPLNRYEDFEFDNNDEPSSLMSPMTPTLASLSQSFSSKKMAAKALYTFQAQNPRELSFKRGDLVYIHYQVDSYWYEGERNAMVGMFPVSYVELLPNDDQLFWRRKQDTTCKMEGKAKVKFSFHAQTQMELSLTKGEMVTLTRKVDQNWYEGRIGNRKGIFPASYIAVITPPPNPGEIIRPPYPTRTSKKACLPPDPPPLAASGNNDVVEYIALFNYKPQNDDEVELKEGDTLYVIEKCDDGWYVGTSKRTGIFGTFPGNYIAKA